MESFYQDPELFCGAWEAGSRPSGVRSKDTSRRVLKEDGVRSLVKVTWRMLGSRYPGWFMVCQGVISRRLQTGEEEVGNGGGASPSSHECVERS